MNPDIPMIFNRTPAVLPLYEAAEAKILEAYPNVKIKVGKTQIGFFNRYGFAWLWPPTRSVKGRPENSLVLTFGLPYRREHPRIVEAVEPYPNRWTHHVIITSADELDDEIMAWLEESYTFSLMKGRKKTTPSRR